MINTAQPETLVAKPRPRVSVILAAISLTLASAAALFLIFWPYSYSGIQVSSEGGQVEVHRSLIEQNGIRVLIPVFFPVLMALIAFLVVKNANPRHAVGKIAIWLPVAVLFLFCAAAALSIGFLYVPSALLMVTAAAFAMKPRPSSQRTTTENP